MLIIDSREQGVIEPIAMLFMENGIDVDVRPLEFGDYIMEVTTHGGQKRKIVIERKTPSDFINSTHPTAKDTASKLARQLNGCLTLGADVVVLLIDGPYFPLAKGRIKTTKMTMKHSYDGMASKLRSVANQGIRVEHNMANWYLPYYLLALYKYEQQDDHSTLSLTPKPFQVPAKSEAKWTLLLGIRGVGPKIAKDLHEHFGSIQAVAEATIDQLKEVKGVGQHTAEAIHFYMH